MATTFAGSKYSKQNYDEDAAAIEEEKEADEDEEEDEEEESDELGSTSSFSLQECINEFRARRIRRVSTQSRDREMMADAGKEQAAVQPTGTAVTAGAADADLINQNRCNKAQERKGKPCKNGFCYCFTSDSGDCASTAPPRDWHVRQHKRSRRSENNKFGVAAAPLPQNNLNAQRIQSRQRQLLKAERKNQAAGAVTSQTSINASPLTAISSLRAVGDDAPLIHIIQELRDNCVISEVRVNRQKLPNVACVKSKPKEALPKMEKTECIDYQPTAPVLSNISEQETPLEECDALETAATSLAGDSHHSTRRSSRRSSGGGGRLLQKRLSQGHVIFKPRNSQEPPPKPPRRSTQSLDGKISLSSLTSTTPSVRDAERVLDDFLLKHGVKLPNSKGDNYSKIKSTRKSYPLAEIEKPMRGVQLATCPSLSDIERVVESKRGVHYAKNIQRMGRKSAVSDKPMKEIMLGWTEPKINDMLNYDAAKQAQFKTHAPQPAPQVASTIGWQVPVVPKISLDTVDGLSENLEVNMEQKHTPIKYPRLPNSKNASKKFIWGEQWRNLSPWNGNKRTGFQSKSKKFLNNSKNKILRFVSPKKSNQEERHQQQQVRHTPRLCTVGVQTSTSQLQLDLESQQSPPGSYHSPVQSTPTASATTTSMSNRQHRYKESSEPYFDFDRKVKPPTPPKKLPRTQRPRKLNFQTESNPAPPTAPTTYRSFHKDLDQDVTITKMGYLLSSIRAKLEASDAHASRTFRECSRFDPVEQSEEPSDSFDCIDGPITRTLAMQRQPLQGEREPIYSEIEEDCMVISGSPQFDVRTAAAAAATATGLYGTTTATITSAVETPVPSTSSLRLPESPAADVNALYARVHKVNKTPEKSTAQPRPLGHFLQESLLNGSFFQFMPLPDEPCSDTSYTDSTRNTVNPASEQHQSLNNINEQHSPPKKHRNLSKSDLSLQRSEIFLENLCRSEIVLDHDDNMRLEKVQNTCLSANGGVAAGDDVSYDMPNDLYGDYVLENSQSQYGSVQLEPPPPSSDNQSTPKKQNQRFTTKPTHTLSIDINDSPTVPGRKQNLSLSCPTTPQQQQPPEKVSNIRYQTGHSSLGELPNESNILSVSALARYRLLKDAVRRSYRKGKSFLVAEKQRLTQSFNMSRDQNNQTEGELDSSTYYASLNLDSLLNESLTAKEQLSQAVSICRQVPQLEISAEMVEAERLLLFSTLRKKTSTLPLREASTRRKFQCLLIDGLRLPVKADVSQDMFFNYYYICTVESEGRIRSTQSIECQHGAAVFQDCGLEFYSDGEAETMELRCQIFMLRLRKVSTLSLEPSKSLLKRGTGSLGSGSSSNSSQCGQIVSRFRLHASFTLRAVDLAPFELLASGTESEDRIWLRSSRTWQLPLTPHTKSSNLMPQIELSGRVELRLPKQQHAGYLNVQDTDPRNKHNWNRRWCTLDGLRLFVWQHEQNLSEEPPMLEMQLEHCPQLFLDVAPRELCARARSFLLQCLNSQAFFAADTQTELVEWLLKLNEALAFARRWLSAS